MRVQCVATPGQSKSTTRPPFIKLGEVYSVVDSGGPSMVQGGYWVDSWYELIENPGVLYDQSLFIPVSDIDETEMIRNYQTQKV